MYRLPRLLIFGLTAFTTPNTQADDNSQNLEVQKVADNVFALVGPLGDRSPENLSNNATYGVVVTPEGVVLIDSGGTYKGAERIHESVGSLTEVPVKLVINTNSQDHRWLGNDYFRRHGARIIAHQKTVEDQKYTLNDKLIRLANTVGEQGMEGTQDAYADEVFDNKLDITLGETTLQLIYLGQAHTPADIIVWLPKEKIMFTGDIVYTERMLSVRPYSNSGRWITAFETMEAFEPEHIVPGHGHVTTLTKARKDTYSYLRFLRQAVADFMNSGGDITDTGSIDQSEFGYLVNYEFLKGRNAQQVFQELEWE
ncbi:MAG: MBL fold metallo-hydrolase [Gammaproteobacteria bacterium]|jgi:glyoxylase-like metal-dependent hydrolase (beta-lactamase superfamily II)